MCKLLSLSVAVYLSKSGEVGYACWPRPGICTLTMCLVLWSICALRGSNIVSVCEFWQVCVCLWGGGSMYFGVYPAVQRMDYFTGFDNRVVGVSCSSWTCLIGPSFWWWYFRALQQAMAPLSWLMHSHSTISIVEVIKVAAIVSFACQLDIVENQCPPKTNSGSNLLLHSSYCVHSLLIHTP